MAIPARIVSQKMQSDVPSITGGSRRPKGSWLGEEEHRCFLMECKSWQGVVGFVTACMRRMKSLSSLKSLRAPLLCDE